MKKLYVFCFAALMLIAFTAPAMAETKIGGIAFVDFLYWDRDAETIAGGVAEGAATAEDDNSNLSIKVNSISRLYARWTNEDNVGLYIEYGLGGQAANGNQANIRHIYGWWDVNPSFSIMAGHSTTAFSPLTPNLIMGTDSGLHVIGFGYGEFYSGRFEQVRFSFNLPEKMGRIEFNLIDPNVNGTLTASPGEAIATDAVGVTANNDTVIPRLELTAALYFGAFRLYPGIFWQEQTFDNLVGDDSITSIGYTLGFAWGTGPFTIEAEYQAGQNWGNARGVTYNTSAGTTSPSQINDALVYSRGGKTQIEDTDQWAGWVDLGFKAGIATIHLVYGMQNAERDAVTGVSGDVDATSTMYGISVPMDLAKGFRLRPEFFIFDNGDDNEIGKTAGGASTNAEYDHGKEMYLGVQFQITF